MTSAQTPTTRYTRSGELSIAYSVTGEGERDILFCSNWTSHLEAVWDWQPFARLMHRFARMGRLILFDPPGAGLSDPVSLVELPTIEQWADYVRGVLDAAGSERAVLFASDAAASPALTLAATHPDRVEALVLYGAFARLHRAPDYPCGIPEERREAGIAWFLDRWGTGRQLELTAPELSDEPYELEPIGRFERYSASPGVARVFFRMISELDVRHVLPAIHIPTLVLHRTGDRWIRVEHGRYLAEHIPGAHLVELPGDNHYAFHGDGDTIIREVRAFVDALPEARAASRMLATILVTDIVDSTRKAAAVGDQRWRTLLDHHDEVVRKQLAQFRGRQVKSTGDGALAVFDGAVRAVRCAGAIRDALRPLGIDVRAGLHSGEVELRGDGVHGLAINIATRVAALAGAGDVLASQTVKELTVGSQLAFEGRGTHALKGVPGEWQLSAAVV